MRRLLLQARTSVANELDGIVDDRRFSPLLVAHQIEAFHGADQVVELVGVFYHEQRAVRHRHRTERQPESQHLIGHAGEERRIAVDTSCPPDRCCAKEEKVLTDNGLAKQHLGEMAQTLPMGWRYAAWVK